MIELRGKYNTAKVFANSIDHQTKDQITELLNQEFAKDSKIRIMPNTHRYNMLGDGWTVDVIAHIFSYLDNTKGGV